MKGVRRRNQLEEKALVSLLAVATELVATPGRMKDKKTELI